MRRVLEISLATFVSRQSVDCRGEGPIGSSAPTEKRSSSCPNPATNSITHPIYTCACIARQLRRNMPVTLMSMVMMMAIMISDIRLPAFAANG